MSIGRTCAGLLAFISTAVQLTLLTSCQDPAAAALELEAVSPDRCLVGESISIQLRGNFPPAVLISYQDPSRSEVDTSFTATIGGLPVEELSYVDAEQLTGMAPRGLAVGVHALSVTAPDGRQATLEQAFTVEEPVTPGARVSIEDRPGGLGAEVGDVSMLRGQQLVLHAVARRADGSFEADLAVSWTLDGAIGALAPTSGATTTLSAETLGLGHVAAEHAGYAADQTGAIEVSSCTRDPDCADLCYTSAACQAGACVMGTADLDLDGDGHVDAACPGGDDCDDAAAGCALDCTDVDADAFCVDQDCDDSAATGAACHDGCVTYFRDQDGDGFGLAATTLSACAAPAGYVDQSGDCADTPGSDSACGGLDGALCLPGGAELCDGADNDCAPVTVDGADEVGFGGSCNGLDPTACGAGTFACDGVALFCDGAVACAANASCAGQGGGVHACECDPGYSGDGLTCTPDSGCTLTCDANASCELVLGSYACICGAGYGGDGQVCTPSLGGVAIARAQDVTAQTAVDLILQEPLNLFTDDGAAPETLADWTLIQNLGDGWREDGIGPFGENRYQVSFDAGIRSRELDLIALGYTDVELDAAPPMAVREWYHGAWPEYDDLYFCRIELRRQNGQVIDSFELGTAQSAVLASNRWERAGTVFTGYGSGLRFIYIEDGGRDTEFWAGHYGTMMSGAIAVFGTIEMRLSSDGQAWGGWEPFAPERAWNLDPTRGVQKVYVEFRDASDQSFLGAAEDAVIVDCTETCDINASCVESGGSYGCVCNGGYTGDGITCS